MEEGRQGDLQEKGSKETQGKMLSGNPEKEPAQNAASEDGINRTP